MTHFALEQLAKERGVKLTRRMLAVMPLVFCQLPLLGREIAQEFGITQQAADHRVQTIYKRFAAAGITLPRSRKRGRPRHRPIITLQIATRRGSFLIE